MNYCGFNIETFCSDVCGDHRRPQTLAEICRSMDSCCGFRAVAAREKYPGLTLLGEVWFSQILVVLYPYHLWYPIGFFHYSLYYMIPFNKLQINFLIFQEIQDGNILNKNVKYFVYVAVLYHNHDYVCCNKWLFYVFPQNGIGTKTLHLAPEKPKPFI